MCLVWYCQRYSERKEEMLPSCTRCQHRFSAIFFQMCAIGWAHCTVCESLPWPHCPVNKQWLLISETDIFRNKWNWIKVLCKPDSSVHHHFSIALMHRVIFDIYNILLLQFQFLKCVSHSWALLSVTLHLETSFLLSLLYSNKLICPLVISSD